MYLDMVSSSELAEMRLATLAVSRQAIEKRAKKEAWPYQESSSQARGGKLKKYLVSGLPAEIQTAIKEKQAAALLAAAEPVGLPAVADVPVRRGVQLGLDVDEAARGLNDKRRACAYARMALAQEVLKMHRVAGLSLKAAIAYVIGQLEAGLLPRQLAELVPVANDRSGGKAKVSARSLLEWTTLYQRNDTANGRLAALAPKPTRTEKPLMSYGWLAYFMQFHCRPSAPKLAHSYEQFADWWLANMAVNDLPSIDQVRRVWNKLPEMMRERGRKTGAAYKALLPYVKRDWDALRPGDVWIGDGHSFKAKVAHPVHGRPFKPEVTVIIDGCSRMAVGFSVSLAESCVAVSDALRIGIKHFGAPLMYYSDNGGGQTGKTIDHEITGLTARLGIHHETGLPGNPQGRGIIEHLWPNTLIKLAREYETFTGAGMDSSTKNLMYRKLESAFNAQEQGRELTDEQRRYKAKLPSWPQFLNDVAACLDAYNKRAHSSLPKTSDGLHYCPRDYYAARMAAENLTAELLSEAELDMMFRPQEIRKVQRGWLDLFNNQYFSADLAAYNKDEVRVAYDLDDAESVLVYDMDGKFLCKAILNGNKRAAFPITVRDQLAEKRAKGRIKRAENVIRLAEAEKNPALEQANAFDELFAGGLNQVIEHESAPMRRTGTDDGIVLFEADFEE